MFTEHCLETLLERMKMFRYLVGDEAEQVIFGRGSCVCTRSEQLSSDIKVISNSILYRYF